MTKKVVNELVTYLLQQKQEKESTPNYKKSLADIFRDQGYIKAVEYVVNTLQRSK